MSKISSGSLTVVDVKGGSDGINTATIYLYQRAATVSSSSKPSTNLIYTFANAKLTGELGSWTQDIGTLTGSDPIWVIAAVANSNGKTDIIEPKDWSEPIKMAQDGQDGQPGAPGQPGTKGLNQATVFIYKRAQSVTKPNDSEYTFETGSFTVTDGWQKTVPAATTENRNPCWVCTAVAIGSEPSVALKWNTPSVLVENGSDGLSPVVTSTDNGVQIYDPVNDVTYTITNGINGTSYFTHILYSSKATPTSASDVSTSPTGKDYVGIQTTTSETMPSWDDSSWQWMKYVGNDGTSITVSSIKYAKSTTDSQPQDSSFDTALPTVGEGEWLWTMTTYSDGSKVYTKSKQGKSGTSVTVSKTEYQAGTSPTTAPTGEWKTTIPSVAEGQYLWTKTTYSDGNYSYTVAKQGKSGTSITISSTSVKYQVGTSATTAPTGEWKDTVQSTTTGQYLWTRTIVTYSDGSDTTSYSVSAHGATGTSISISSIKYATSTTDSQPADSSFGTSIPTVSEGQWLWTMTTYSNGSKMYTKSKQGKSGVSVTKTRELYYLKTNSTNVPTITAASQITTTDRENGWTSVVPTYAANGTYYTCIETSLSAGGPVWSTPVENQGLTDANANAAESLSVSTHANENAQGALSISRATQQHFWFVSENTGSGASLIEAGAYITDTPIDTFKNGKSGGYLLARSDGIILGKGTNRYMELSGSELKFYKAGTTDSTASTASNVAAKLSSTGLEIANGSITLGNYFSVTNEGVLTAKSGTIGGWSFTDAALYYSNATPGYSTSNLVISKNSAVNANAIAGSETNKHWFLAAGRNFGVDTEGVLYASGANIQGKITVTTGSNVYTTDDVNPLEVGGRNLLIGTAKSISKATTATTNYVTQPLYDTPNQVMLSELGFAVNDETTLSFDWEVTSATTYGNARIEWYGKKDSTNMTYIAPLINPFATFSASNVIGHVETTVKLTAATIQSKRLVLRIDNSNLTLTISNLKLEKGNKATDWMPAPEDLAAIATNYISADSNGIRIASANPAIQSQRIELTNSELSMYSSDNIKRVSVASGTGVWVGRSDKGHSIINDNGLYVYDTNNKLALEATSNGVTVYKANVDVGNFGETARIGKSNGSHFLMNASSLQAFDSSGTKYFEVSSSGISFGNVTQDDILNSAIDIPTKVSELTNDSGYQNSTQVSGAIDEVRSYYIANIDSKNGITIKAVNGTTSGSDTSKQNYIKLNADGLEIYKGGDSVAFYGDTARIGKVSSDKIEITPTAFSASNSSGVEGFRVELNAPGVEGWTPATQDKTSVSSVNSGTITYSGIPSGSQLMTSGDASIYFLGTTGAFNATTTGDLIYGWGSLYNRTGIYINLRSQTFTYGTSKTITDTMTARFNNNITQSYTVTLQYNGSNKITITVIPPSGDSTDMIYFPSMYYYGRVERSTAVTAGSRSGATGAFSIAMGEGLIASEPYSVAFGSYNDANETYRGNKILFSLGNGTANDVRSNAFCVDAIGDIYIGLNYTPDVLQGESIDKYILQDLADLGWDGSDDSTNIDVIVHFYDY